MTRTIPLPLPLFKTSGSNRLPVQHILAFCEMYPQKSPLKVPSLQKWISCGVYSHTARREDGGGGGRYLGMERCCRVKRAQLLDQQKNNRRLGNKRAHHRFVRREMESSLYSLSLSPNQGFLNCEWLERPIGTWEGYRGTHVILPPSPDRPNSPVRLTTCMPAPTLETRTNVVQLKFRGMCNKTFRVDRKFRLVD